MAGIKKKPPARPVNLNTASSAELQEVPGIGPATTNKILQARESYGAFKRADDLQACPRSEAVRACHVFDANEEPSAHQIGGKTSACIKDGASCENSTCHRERRRRAINARLRYTHTSSALCSASYASFLPE